MNKAFTWHDIIFGILKFNVLTGYTYTVLLNKKFISFIHFFIFLFSSLLLIKALDGPKIGDVFVSDPLTQSEDFVAILIHTNTIAKKGTPLHT